MHPYDNPTIPSEKYLILGLVGNGGMSVVYRVRRLALGDVQAIKVLADGVLHYGAQERFRREALMGTKFAHPNIVRTIDYDIGPDGGAYIVMEWVDGMDLRLILNGGRCFADYERSRLLGDVARGLTYAHESGVIHRDVKPANIIIEKSTGSAKLLDFGIAVFIDPAAYSLEPVTQDGSLVGTKGYLSPERLYFEPATAASDIYSLALIAYELYVGRPPHDLSLDWQSLRDLRSSNPQLDYPKSVPPNVRSAISRALDPDPLKRHVSAVQFIEELTTRSVPPIVNNVVNQEESTQEMDANGTVVYPSETYDEDESRAARRKAIEEVFFDVNPLDIPLRAGKGLMDDDLFWRAVFVLVPALIGAIAAIILAFALLGT